MVKIVIVIVSCEQWLIVRWLAWKPENKDYDGVNPIGFWFLYLMTITRVSSGWWFQPLWKIWKSIGSSSQLLGNIKVMFQTTNQSWIDLPSGGKSTHIPMRFPMVDEPVGKCITFSYTMISSGLFCFAWNKYPGRKTAHFMVDDTFFPTNLIFGWDELGSPTIFRHSHMKHSPHRDGLEGKHYPLIYPPSLVSLRAKPSDAMFLASNFQTNPSSS